MTVFSVETSRRRYSELSALTTYCNPDQLILDILELKVILECDGIVSTAFLFDTQSNSLNKT